MKYINKNKLTLGKKSDDIKENLDLLLRYIYHSFRLDHDKMKPLYENVKVPVTYDFNEEYDNDYYLNSKLKLHNCSKVDGKYYYIFDEDDYDKEYYENSPFIEQLQEYLLKKSPKKLKIGDLINLRVNNIVKPNKDIRGCRYLDWRLHFWDTYEKENLKGITLHDFIIGAFKIKSHKFDNNYEMYLYVTNYYINENSIHINIDFDHGS